MPSIRQTLLRLAVASSLALTFVIAGFPPSTPGFAAPATVVARADVDLGSLLPTSAGRPIRLRDGQLHALRTSRTGSVRVCSDVWFTALGMTWEQRKGSPLEAHVAISRDGLSFGRARALDAESGPDRGSSEFARGSAASTLLWTGGGWCARVAFDLAAGTTLTDPQVVFVNSSGSSHGPGTAPPDAGAANGVFDSATASAMTRQPRFISRERWGANPHLMNCEPDVAPAVKMGFVHHTAGTNRYSRAEADDIVRAIYAYHTRGRGWCDIAYNFLVDRFGRAYEGRSGGITTPVVGAAQQGFNTGAFSVSLMGSFSSTRPRPPMVRTLRRVLAWRLDVAHVPPKGRAEMVSAGGPNTRYDAGKRVNLPVISLHRTTGYTDCPGQRVSSMISRIRDKVAKLGLPKLYNPSVDPGVIEPGGEAPRIFAKGSMKLVWNVSVKDPGGATVATFPKQRGLRLSYTWRGSGAEPYPSEPGEYFVIIEAHRRGGQAARAAKIPLSVRA